MFEPLNNKHIQRIVELHLEGVKRTLETKHEIELEFTQQAMDYLAETGFDPQFGARPIKRVIQRKVLNVLSKKLLLNEIEAKSKVVIDSFGEGLVFRRATESNKE